MQGGTESQKARIRKTNWDAAFSIFWEALCAVGLLWFRAAYVPHGGLRVVLLVLAIIDMALIIPILFVRHERIKEILGGEEDEARKY